MLLSRPKIFFSYSWQLPVKKLKEKTLFPIHCQLISKVIEQNYNFIVGIVSEIKNVNLKITPHVIFRFYLKYLNSQILSQNHRFN